MESEVYKAMFEREERFWWHRGMREIVKSLLERYLPRKENLRILDAGCGTGGMFKLLSRYGQITGLDALEEAVKLAQKRGTARVVLGAVEKLPFPNASFDLVVCLDVLYHRNVSSDIGALAEFYRVLSPGGFLLIREAAYDWLKSRHDQLVWTRHRYTLRELRQKIRQAGFSFKKISYVNFFLFPLAALVRLFEKVVKPNSKDLAGLFTAPRLINWLFFSILKFEAFLLKRIKFPLGLSIFVVAQKQRIP